MRNLRYLLLTIAGLMFAGGTLNHDALQLLQDPGGWEYIKMSIPESGFQTAHVCFDGTPHPNECSGNLTLRADKTFVQQVRIKGQTVARHGRYELNGNQLAFYDELQTKDGPYSVDLNPQTKALVLSMPQIRIELELEREYKKAQANKAKAAGK